MAQRTRSKHVSKRKPVNYSKKNRRRTKRTQKRTQKRTRRKVMTGGGLALPDVPWSTVIAVAALGMGWLKCARRNRDCKKLREAAPKGGKANKSGDEGGAP
jgi:hypothetical protein